MNSHVHVYRNGIAVSVVLYVSALMLPALIFAAHDPVPGYHLLLFGWVGLLSFQPAWLANALFVAGLVLSMRGRRSSAKICAWIAVPLGLCSLWTREWYFNEGSGTPIEHFGPAFYAWIAAFAVLAVLPTKGPDHQTNDDDETH